MVIMGKVTDSEKISFMIAYEAVPLKTRLEQANVDK